MVVITRTSTALLEGLKDGSNKGSWSQFHDRYRPLIMAVAKRLGLSVADAEDAAQETMTAFVQAYRLRQYNKEKGRLRDWLCGIACHKIRDIQRKQKRSEKLIIGKAIATAPVNQIEDVGLAGLWDDEWEKATLRQALEEVRQQVAPATFEAFMLFALEQWPAKRVADHLQVSEDAVYQSKRRVLNRLRELLPKINEIW